MILWVWVILTMLGRLLWLEGIWVDERGHGHATEVEASEDRDQSGLSGWWRLTTTRPIGPVAASST